MEKPFIVFFDNHWGDRLELARFATFEAACEEYVERRKGGPRSGVDLELHNEDNYDYDCSDGLDSEQRDIVWSGGVP